MISIVIPVYNEEKNISVLHEQIKEVLSSSEEYQIIFVNDGSVDKTLEKIKAIHAVENNVFYLSFSRNFGHQNALRAGLDHCYGDAVITMDGDLQQPPSLLPKMISLWKEGYKIVYTVREENQEIGRAKQWTSKCFYRAINLISDVNLKQGSADFRLLDKLVVKELRKYKEKDVFYRGIISGLGFKQCEISYVPDVRKFGNSKYSLVKMVGFALSGITSFSIVPLRISTLLGFLIAFLSLIYGFYAVCIKILGINVVPGWASIMAGIYFIGGIQLIALGVCGEYIGRILLEVKKRPNYIIQEAQLPGKKYEQIIKEQVDQIRD